MRTIATVIGLGIALLGQTAVMAQEPPPAAESTKEHKWLHQLVGEWETEAEAPATPGQPEFKCKGTLRARKLGELWVVTEINMNVSATPVTGLQVLGYDPKTKKYVGTWVDSVMNHMWKYDGTLDAEGKVLTLEAEGPDMVSEGKTAKYRDVFEFTSKDEIKTTSQMLGPDGQWVTFMSGTARRVK